VVTISKTKVPKWLYRQVAYHSVTIAVIPLVSFADFQLYIQTWQSKEMATLTIMSSYYVKNNELRKIKSYYCYYWKPHYNQIITRISCCWQTHVTCCIMANVLQTNKVDAQCDKLVTELSWQCFASKVANFQLLHLRLTYPTCIWCLHWGWPRLSFAEIFRNRKLESLGYRVALPAWFYVKPFK